MRNLFLLLSLTLTVNLLAADEPLDNLLWEATASNHSGDALRAIDGDPASRWATGAGQAVGQWFQIDMGEVRDLSRVEVDSTGSNNDYFRQYALTVSLDGQNWQPAASGKGELVTKITLPKPVTCRYVRVAIPEGSDLAGGFWSIHEIRLFGGAPFGQKALPRPAMRWRVVPTVYPTRDVVIAAYNITDFGVNPAKNEDITLALRLATKLLSKAGGGTLWLPAGHYRMSESITLDNNVTVRGDWTAPQPGRPIDGTIIELTASRGDADASAAFKLGNASALIGINFWWPEQDAAKPVPYPVAVRQVGGKGMGLENITFVNAYRGFACEPDGCALFFLRNVYGTVLETGIEIDGTSDIGRMEAIYLSPAYWSNSGLPKSPAANGPHAAWMLDNGTAIAMRRNDWSYAYDVNIEGYKIGFHALPSNERLHAKQTRPGLPNGTNGKFRITKCRTGIQFYDISNAGMLFYDIQISNVENGIVTEETFGSRDDSGRGSHAEFRNVTVSASDAAVRLLGTGQLFFDNSQLTGSVENENGYIALAGTKSNALPKAGKKTGVGEIKILPASPTPVAKSTLVYTTPNERYAPGAAGVPLTVSAAATSTRGAVPATRVTTTAPTMRGNVVVSGSAAATPVPAPAITTTPPTVSAPVALAVVTDAAYGAQGDAAADDTAAVKKAIAAVAQSGGIVFFPAGEYRVTSELVVPSNVELRGVNECPHHAQTRGSIIDVIPGKGNASGTPFITLSAKSGLRGLTFHYPELDVFDLQPYPWTVRGNGADIWVINTTCTFAYQFLDFATNRCDRHFIDYAAGHGFKTAFAVGGGSVGGRLINCQLNPNYYAFTNSYANSPDVLNRKNKEHRDYFDATDAYAKQHADAFNIGDCSDQILFHNFVFGARRGLALTGTTTGPSGWCFGHGSDQCGWGLYVEKVGAEGMPLINNQLVTVSERLSVDRGYIKLDKSFTGTLFCLGVNAWGGPTNAVEVDGGRLVLSSFAVSNSGKTSYVLRGKGAVSVTNARLAQPGVILERASLANDAQFNGDLVPGKNGYFADDLKLLAEDDLAIITSPDNSIGGEFPENKALPVTGWKVRASARPENAQRAIDGDMSTRWDTGRGAKRGEEFIVDLDQPRTISKVRINATGSNNDYPRRFRLYLSADGKNWGDPIVSGAGATDLKIAFKPQTAKFIRIVNMSEMGGFWSIHEIQVAE